MTQVQQHVDSIEHFLQRFCVNSLGLNHEYSMLMDYIQNAVF
jgi:hypothetical protein